MSDSAPQYSKRVVATGRSTPPWRFRLRERLKTPTVRLLNFAGFDWHRRHVPSTKAGLVLALKQMGWYPETCIDVGAAWGTPEIQYGFPKSRHVLIEPSPQFSSHLASICHKRGWTWLQAAASDHKGQAQFFLGRHHLGGRVVPKILALKFPDGLIDVPTFTLDEMDAQHEFGKHLLVKIDVEGHESHVISGAASVLRRTEVVVIETSPLRSTTSSDIVAQMLDHDFLLAGFITPWVASRRWPQLQMVDLVFFKKGSPLLQPRLVRSRR